MEIKYDTQLMEAVVIEEVERNEREGDYSLYQTYHKIADLIYELSPEEREEHFERLHSNFFFKLGMGKVIAEVLEEFLWLDNRVREIGIKKADSEESSLLGRDRNSIVIKLRPDKFLEISNLKRFLRHELMHVYDMLDEEFGYSRGIQSNSPAEESFKRARYGVIWDIYIDGRLIKEGKDTFLDKDAHYQEFEGVYRGIPSSLRLRIFEKLWVMEKMSHREILEMVEDPNKLLEKVYGEKPARIFLPGSACPLCNFPTYKWREDLNQTLDRKIIEIIKKNHPRWEPEQGACDRCIELYELSQNLKTVT